MKMADGVFGSQEDYICDTSLFMFCKKTLKSILIFAPHYPETGKNRGDDAIE
jgi:hypothetical protein